MKLVNALRLTAPEWTPVRLALVGAGGKTSLMFNLARELISDHLVKNVLVTTTTHLAVHQVALADHHFKVESTEDVEKAFHTLPFGVILFSGSNIADDRVEGPGEEVLVNLVKMADELHLPVLVEADGARQRLIKAPAAHEPLIPIWANYVVVLASLAVLGKPVSEQWVHRPERFRELVAQSSCPAVSGEGITPRMLAAILTHPQGGLKNIPAKSRRVVVLNDAFNSTLAAQAKRIKDNLLQEYEAVVVANMRDANWHGTRVLSDESVTEPVLAVYERAAGVILAAGGSSRLGNDVSRRANGVPDGSGGRHYKQLLSFRGEPLVRHVCKAAINAQLDQVIVVTGCGASEVNEALTDLDLSLVNNPSWEEGQSSSLVKGLLSVNPGTGAVIFFLADQPLVSPALVQSLLELHTQTLSPLVAPQVTGKRANPVLFDRSTFHDLLALKGDVGGRALFSRYPVTWLSWLDESLLMDVDTWQDYERLINLDHRSSRLAAVVLAAGRSLRMGRPKMLLPWGNTSVIRHVTNVLMKSGLGGIYVVTGSDREKIEAELAGTSVELIFNPLFAEHEMLVSIQTGLSKLPDEVEAALIVLGDQPQIESAVIEMIIKEFRTTGHHLIVPSYQMRRGHPWLVHRSFWNEIMDLKPNQTLRDFLVGKAEQIHYLNVEHPSILKDLDTMDDWDREHP